MAETASSSKPGSPSSPPKCRPSPLSNDPPRKRRGVVPSEALKKTKSDVYHLKKDDVPEDAAGFKTALEIHIRILLGAVTNASVPEAPDAHNISTFEQRFTTASEVDRLLKGNTTGFRNVDRVALRSLGDLRARCAIDPTSTIILSISRVPENALRLMFGAIHSFGLSAWRPDFLSGTPTSLYNGALETIAIWTFEQAMTTFAYQHLAPNLRYLQDTVVMQKLYRNFVWSYMRGLVLKEKKEPGSVSRALRDNKAYKHRSELTKRRQKYLKENGWNSRVQLLAGEVECTSDQEPNPDGPGFLIMLKRARNPHITDFNYTIDSRRKHGTPVFRGQRKNTRREEVRIPHPGREESRISERLPRTCPLDWFDPEYFNGMDIAFRALYIAAPIALPLKEDCDLSVSPDWKTMPDAAFMEKYGNRVRAKYQLPTEEELQALNNSDDDEDGEVEEILMS